VDILNSPLFVIIGAVGSLIAIGLFVKDVIKKGLDILTIVIALSSALLLGLYFYQRSHLSFFFSGLSVCLGAVLFAGALLICGELFLRRAALQTSMGKKLLWFTIFILLLSSVPFWMMWAPSVPSQPAVTLQAYCQALVNHDFAGAMMYFSGVEGPSPLSQSDLAQHVGADEKQTGNLRACISTASEIVTSSGDTSYAGGSVIYTFRPGVWYFKSYNLFQSPSSSTWLIDAGYWKDPHAPGV